jgi:hypothetical protein
MPAALAYQAENWIVLGQHVFDRPTRGPAVPSASNSEWTLMRAASSNGDTQPRRGMFS